MARDLASMILRRSIGALATRDDAGCARCHRVPVPGELVHVADSGSRLCSLCASELPDTERHELRAERVHSYERHVFAVPRAA